LRAWLNASFSSLDILGMLYGLTLRLTAPSQSLRKLYPYIQDLTRYQRKKGKSDSRSPILSPFAGVRDGSPDAGESPLLFKGFVVEASMNILAPSWVIALESKNVSCQFPG